MAKSSISDRVPTDLESPEIQEIGENSGNFVCGQGKIMCHPSCSTAVTLFQTREKNKGLEMFTYTIHV